MEKHGKHKRDADEGEGDDQGAGNKHNKWAEIKVCYLQGYIGTNY